MPPLSVSLPPPHGELQPIPVSSVGTPRPLGRSLDLLCQPHLCMCFSHQYLLLKLAQSTHGRTGQLGHRPPQVCPQGLAQPEEALEGCGAQPARTHAARGGSGVGRAQARTHTAGGVCGGGALHFLTIHPFIHTTLSLKLNILFISRF